MRRRQYLAVTGASLASALAGCSGGNGGDGGDGGSTGGSGGSGGSGGDDLPPKDNFEAYEEAWLEMVVERIDEEETGEVVIWGMGSDEDEQAHVEEFFANTEPYSEVLEANVPTGSPDNWAQQYQQAKTAGESIADVMVITQVVQLREQGVPVGDLSDVPAWVELPDNLRAQDDELGDLGVGRVNSRLMSYNTDLVDEPPSSWGDLATDEWAGRNVALEFNPEESNIPKFLNQTFEVDGEEYSAEEFVPMVTDNVNMMFEGFAPGTTEMVGRGEADLSLFGMPDYTASQMEDGMPIDVVRVPETIYPYATAFGIDAEPLHPWAAQLAAHAFIKEPDLQLRNFGSMTPNREHGYEHPEFGNTKDLYEGSEIDAPFQYDNLGEHVTEFQQLWGAPV